MKGSRNGCQSTPARPNLDQYKKQAKDLLKACKAGDAVSMQRIGLHLPERRNRGTRFSLADAQFTIARRHRFESWTKFAKHVEALSRERKVASLKDPREAFIRAACVPREWHASGTLEDAEAILAAYPERCEQRHLYGSILGDDAAVSRFLSSDPGNAMAKGGPYDWDALTYLCFSRYLRIDRARSDGFVRAAKALLDAGANANTGWMENDHEPHPTWESVIYGAAGNGAPRRVDATFVGTRRGSERRRDGLPCCGNTRQRALKVLVESGKPNEKGW